VGTTWAGGVDGCCLSSSEPRTPEGERLALVVLFAEAAEFVGLSAALAPGGVTRGEVGPIPGFEEGWEGTMTLACIEDCEEEDWEGVG